MVHWVVAGVIGAGEIVNRRPPPISLSIYDYPARLFGTRDHGIDWFNDRFEKEFDGVQDVFELQVS